MLRLLIVLNELVADEIDISVDPIVVAVALPRCDPFCTFCVFSCPRSDNSNLSPSLMTQSISASQFYHRNKLMFTEVSINSLVRKHVPKKSNSVGVSDLVGLAFKYERSKSRCWGWFSAIRFKEYSCASDMPRRMHLNKKTE